MEHAFTQTIKAVLQKYFGAQADELFERSLEPLFSKIVGVLCVLILVFSFPLLFSCQTI